MKIVSVLFGLLMSVLALYQGGVCDALPHYRMGGGGLQLGSIGVGAGRWGSLILGGGKGGFGGGRLAGGGLHEHHGIGKILG